MENIIKRSADFCAPFYMCGLPVSKDFYNLKECDIINDRQSAIYIGKV